MRFWLMLAALLFVMPLHAAHALPEPQAQSPAIGEVQEPDEGDLEQLAPPEPAPMPAPVKEKTKKEKRAEKKAQKAAEKAAEKSGEKPAEANGEDNYNEVILQGLNKVTARASTLEAPIGSVVRFGTIEIVAHSCWKSAPEERPENAALLEISEIKQGEAPTRIFLGWMFSSSPGLSSLEHAFYDVTVLECKQGKP